MDIARDGGFDELRRRVPKIGHFIGDLLWQGDAGFSLIVEANAGLHRDLANVLRLQEGRGGNVNDRNRVRKTAPGTRYRQDFLVPVVAIAQLFSSELRDDEKQALKDLLEEIQQAFVSHD